MGAVRSQTAIQDTPSWSRAHAELHSRATKMRVFLFKVLQIIALVSLTSAKNETESEIKDAETHFELLDKNEDETLTEDELLAKPDAQIRDIDNMGWGVMSHLANNDTDDDAISPAEFFEFMKKMQHNEITDGDILDALVAVTNRNQTDDFITKEEMGVNSTMWSSVLEISDSNGDHKLDKSEFKCHVARMKNETTAFAHCDATSLTAAMSMFAMVFLGKLFY